MTDLFGNPVIEDGPAMTPAEQRKLTRRDPKPNGYAMPPGGGPFDETCGSCSHHVISRHAKDYHKCELTRAKWTHGRATDILVRSPACAKWERKP